MKLWKAIVLLNLAVGVGLLIGYLWWGREVARLRQETTRSLQAAVASGEERQWTVRGVVRSVIPEINVLVLTHEEIPGFMPSMTMGFRTATPQLYNGLEVGDRIRFTLKGVPPNVTIVAITREGKS
ncbi:MAG: copper-binding protein [Candidatus Rokubacteria bacterium]|nr:copper-binding protein [Candidatus Rokubacteria bacterium]